MLVVLQILKGEEISKVNSPEQGMRTVVNWSAIRDKKVNEALRNHSLCNCFLKTS